MIGVYGIGWGSSSAYWARTAAAGQGGRITAVSRAQTQAADQPVTPVTAAPTVSQDQPSGVTLTGPAAVSNYREGADPVEL